MSTKEYPIVESVESFAAALARVKAAQKEFATYSQEQVDAIFLAAATAASRERLPLAKMAVEETGMGVVEDKVIKNHFASEYIYNTYRDTKTCGVIEEDKVYGTIKIAEPIGVIGAVIPTTNPTSTAIFKALIALKTRNGIIISPHPRAKKSTIAAAKIVLEAGGRGRRSRGHHLVDRRSVARADEHADAGIRLHPRDRRSRNGQGGLLQRQARSGRRRRQYARDHHTERRYPACGQLDYPLQDL